MRKLFLGTLLFTFICTISFVQCSSTKATMERRNLMMPKVSDLPKNSKFREVDYKSRYKNTNKTKKVKKRSRNKYK